MNSQNPLIEAAVDRAGASESVGRTRLQRMRLPLMSLVLVLVAAAIAYYYHMSGRFESTDDAYTQAAMVSISADVAGRVSAIYVRDNDLVKTGESLFKLDDVRFRIAVENAAAHLAAVRLQIASLKSSYRQRLVELHAARDTLTFATQQRERQARLLASGIASHTQDDQAAHSLDAARQQVANVEQQIGAALAELGGDPDITPERHPLVQEAQAALDQANLELSYTTIKAPAEGIVTKVEQLQVGNYIAASTPVFALVATHDVWIEANFKEVQVAQMRPGDKATVTIDRFGGREFPAVITSLSPGTGSQFALLPPENATGNWVKVVQRVPVRLQLTDVGPGFLTQAGLSAEVKVNIHSRDSPQVTAAAPRSPEARPGE